MFGLLWYCTIGHTDVPKGIEIVMKNQVNEDNCFLILPKNFDDFFLLNYDQGKRRFLH